MKVLLFLTLFILAACSTSLKHKYSYQRSPSSMADSEVTVSRVEISLKDPFIFSSGADSTFILVKLFDIEGNPVTKVNPAELSLASSEDLEAKPFSLKQGVYKAEIKPQVKSPDIQLQVDWLGRVTSQIVVLETTMWPVKDSLRPNNNEYSSSTYQNELNYMRGSEFPETMYEGFTFDNVGDNDIVNSTRFPYSQRSFSFEYPEQARQNMSLQVDDAPNETVSHTMHSIFMFFPRKILPYAVFKEGQLVVTLPNEEKILFNPESKEVIGGVFQEGEVDTSGDRFKRRYADLRYEGKGIVLRVNARGQSPQLGQFENTKIDTEYGTVGSADVLIMNGATGQRCRRPKKDFWEPIDVNPILFKFPTDKEFDEYLKSKCGFGLPQS
ncbi:MAG: hypothetical protein ACOVP4_09030 [Bacteriovoracaceae bacterium]